MLLLVNAKSKLHRLLPSSTRKNATSATDLVRGMSVRCSDGTLRTVFDVNVWDDFVSVKFTCDTFKPVRFAPEHRFELV